MRRLAIAVVLAAAPTARAESLRYGVGRTPTPAEIAALDISVNPSGTGLPAGRGSARDGASLYATLCAGCHGVRGEGVGDFPALAGGTGSLRTPSPVLTVGSYWPYATTVWDYISRTMPYQQPGTLTADQAYALTAVVLELNGIVQRDTELDRASVPLVQMPNRNGFVADPRPDVGAHR